MPTLNKKEVGKLKDFTRALVTTLAVTALLLILSMGFVLINEKLGESGFSSGEVLFLRLDENAFYGEVVGEEFYLSTAPAKEFFAALRPAVFILPPPLRFVLRVIVG